LRYGAPKSAQNEKFKSL